MYTKPHALYDLEYWIAWMQCLGRLKMVKAVRIAIVEDSATDRELIKKNLHQYEKENDIRFDSVEFSDGEDLVVNYTADYDLIFMDIQMAFMDGMKTAQRVRKLDFDVLIIFLTNLPQYAIEGYKVNAFDYILKPISWPSFRESVSRALLRIKPREKEYVTVSIDGGKTKLQVDRICYVEAQDHILLYNTLDGRIMTKGTMQEAEMHLGTDRFFRCSRSYLVNLSYVETYRGCDISVNGDMIQVSRRRRKDFLNALNMYINGENV